MRVCTNAPDGTPVDLTVVQKDVGGRYRWRVTWCSRWDLVDLLANAGILERENLGPGTYGHCEFFYP